MRRKDADSGMGGDPTSLTVTGRRRHGKKSHFLRSLSCTGRGRATALVGSPLYTPVHSAAGFRGAVAGIILQEKRNKIDCLDDRLLHAYCFILHYKNA